MRLVLRAAALGLIWTGLWGDLRFPTFITGFGAGLSVLLMWRYRAVDDNASSQQKSGRELGKSHWRQKVRINPLRASIYLVVFMYLLIKSTIDLTLQTLHPRPRINQAIVGCQMQSGSTLIATIVANTISMTPGTLTIEISDRPRRLFIHTLRYSEKKPNELQDTVELLERLALRAIRSVDGSKEGRR